MIEVRIRRALDAKSCHFADIYDVSEIDTVRRAIIAWGIADEDNLEELLSGQWVVKTDEAYFEFVIEDPV